MIVAENQSSLLAGSRLGQFEEATGDESVGGGSVAGGAGATTILEPGERVHYPTRLSSHLCMHSEKRPSRSSD